jgi:hypothetical protein
MLAQIKHLVVHVLKKDMTSPSVLKCVIGTHMLRKTGFLFACWSFCCRDGWCDHQLNPLDQAAILTDARHEDMSSTMTHLGDSATLKTLVERIDSKNIRHFVGRCLPICVKIIDTFASTNLHQEGHVQMKNKRSLGDLADWHVERVLNMDPSMLGKFSIAHLFNVASKHKPDLSLETEVDALVKAKFTPEERKWARASLDKTERERARDVMNHVIDTAASPGRSIEAEGAAAASGSEAAKEEAAKKAAPVKNVVEFQKDVRKEVNSTTDKCGKVALLIHATNEIKKQVRDGKRLVDPLKRWAHRAGAVSDCVFKCHAEDIVCFLNETPEFSLKKFTCKNGKNHKATFNRTKL